MRTIGFHGQTIYTAAAYGPKIVRCRIATPQVSVRLRLEAPIRREDQREPLEQAGFFDCGEMHFEVYQGKGGHLLGETVRIDYEHHTAFTGDIYINIHGMTREQAEYNRYAPVLMTSVDTDPALCAAERSAILQRLGAGTWKIFGAHGMMKEYNLRAE